MSRQRAKLMPQAGTRCPHRVRQIMSATSSRAANSAPSQQPLGLAHAPAEGDGVETSPVVADSVAKTTCYMCACRCGIDVHRQGRQGPLHQRQQGPSGEPRRALRQGQRRHHAALQPGAAEEAAAAHRAARFRRVPRDRMGRGAGNSHGAPFAHTADRSEKTRLLHRPRPVAVADRLVGLEIRHAELCRAWRLLLGQHGRRRHLYDRRLVLGVRRARLGPHEILHAVRRRRGPRFQPDQDRARQAQGARREDRLGQSRAAPATTPSPTTGSVSGRGRTGCSCWRSCTSF